MRNRQQQHDVRVTRLRRAPIALLTRALPVLTVHVCDGVTADWQLLPIDASVFIADSLIVKNISIVDTAPAADPLQTQN